MLDEMIYMMFWDYWFDFFLVDLLDFYSFYLEYVDSFLVKRFEGWMFVRFLLKLVLV